jgi:hypothetical protein
MDEQICISEQNWLKYSVGKLNADEIRLLNSHCQNCEICSDIKEGIDVMKTPTALESQINNINNKIDQKTKKRFLFLNVTTISIAASVLFGLLLFWFLFPSQNHLAIKPEKINTQTESGLKLPEQEIVTNPKLTEFPQKTSPKKQNIKNDVEPINPSQTKVLNDNLSVTESVSSEGTLIQQGEIAPPSSQAESDVGVTESKSTQIPPIVDEQSRNVLSKETAPKVEQVSRKTKSLYEPSSKKQSLSSANNVNISNNNQVELIKDIDLKSSNDKNLQILQEADVLFNESKFDKSLMICDSMLNLNDKPYFSSFVLLKTKIFVSESNKKKGYDYLKEQIKKHKIKDKMLLDYLKILKE